MVVECGNEMAVEGRLEKDGEEMMVQSGKDAVLGAEEIVAAEMPMM